MDKVSRSEFREMLRRWRLKEEKNRSGVCVGFRKMTPEDKQKLNAICEKAKDAWTSDKVGFEQQEQKPELGTAGIKEKIVKILGRIGSPVFPVDIESPIFWLEEAADEILKMAEFEMLCNPDLYEVSINEHFEQIESNAALQNEHMSLGLKDTDFKKYQELESEISALEQELITDSDIEAWADTQERRLTSYHMGLQAGAKALRDGEIKRRNNEI